MKVSSKRYLIIIWFISVILSVIVRLPGLYGASFWWRANQTELTAFWFEKEGINLINYITPLYGPPWQIPFEFPLFQATAAALSKIGLGNILFTCRLSALFYFYVTTLFLYLLCAKIIKDAKTNFIIISLYLWLPYNIYYSTEPLIDYAALSVTLAYFYFIFSWLKHSHRLIFVLLAIVSGSLAVLVKPTTLPVVIIPIIAFVLRDIYQKYKDTFEAHINLRSLFSRIWLQRGYWLNLLLIAAIPLLLGYLWTRHADDIKFASIFTQWLTSKSLRGWNFGSLALRLDQFRWLEYLRVGQRWLVPYGSALFMALGIFDAIGIVKHRNSNWSDDLNLFLISIGISIILTFGIFVNLYLHMYYFIAWSASVCILTGYGISIFWELRPKISMFFTFLFTIWAVFFIGFNIRDFRSLSATMKSDTIKWNDASTWAKQVQQYVPEDKWVVIIDYDWSPTYPYLLERKSMVFSPKDKGKPICKMVRNENFKLVVLADPNYHENLIGVLNCYNSSVEVMPNVYQIEH